MAGKAFSTIPQDLPTGIGREAKERWALQIARMQAQQTGKRPDPDAILTAMVEGESEDDEETGGESAVSRVPKAANIRGDTKRAQGDPRVIRCQAPTEKELQKQVRAAKKGRRVLTETYRTMYEAIIVYE